MTFDPQKVRLLCFDIDGTLADTDDVMVEWLNRFIKPFNLIFPNLNTLRISRKIILAIETPANIFLTILDALGIDEVYYRICRQFISLTSRPPKKFRLIVGAESTLNWLAKTYLIAIISVRSEQATIDFFKQTGLQECISYYASAESCRHTKPYPDPILFIARKANISPENCVMIGDTTIDIHAGRKAGTQTIGVLSGFGVESELRKAGADLILPDVSYLIEILPTHEVYRTTS